ncbi:MAG: YraN family protein [Bacteroidales bacterium]|nr:YraN family protein [Bacteroidales bacterium]
MAEHNQLGTEGEKLAMEFLVHEGYHILATNWRYKHKEIDIVAKHNETLIVVEVKTRNRYDDSEFDDLITSSKQKFIVEAAEYYLEKHNLDNELRYDVIIVEINNNKHHINHIEEAFYG